MNKLTEQRAEKVIDRLKYFLKAWPASTVGGMEIRVKNGMVSGLTVVELMEHTPSDVQVDDYAGLAGGISDLISFLVDCSDQKRDGSFRMIIFDSLLTHYKADPDLSVSMQTWVKERC